MDMSNEYTKWLTVCRAFSFSSNLVVAWVRDSWTWSNSFSICWIFFWRARTSSSVYKTITGSVSNWSHSVQAVITNYLLRSEVGIAGLLLCDFSSVDGIVLLKLHCLHLLLNGLHFFWFVVGLLQLGTDANRQRLLSGVPIRRQQVESGRQASRSSGEITLGPDGSAKRCKGREVFGRTNKER